MLTSDRVQTSPAALECIESGLDRLFDPPSVNAQELREAIAAKFNLPIDCVAVGNGSTELMNILAKARQQKDGETVFSSPSFVLYEHLAKLYGYRLNAVPLKGYHHDLELMRSQIRENTRIVFLDSPANVTGCTVADNDFLAFLDSLSEETIVVYDNVYAEYQDADSDQLIRHLIIDCRYPVLVCRSFSKAHCLFGLRVGYMLGRSDLIDVVRHYIMPFSLGSLAQCAAIASLRDDISIQRNVELNRKARNMVCTSLDALGISYIPTQSNALLVDFGDQIKRIASHLSVRGVRIRDQVKCRIPGHLQVFLIDPISIQPFIGAVEDYFGRKKS